MGIRGNARRCWDSEGVEIVRSQFAEGTSEVNVNSTVRVVVEPSGSGVVAHVGLHALGCFADRLALGKSLSGRVLPAGERLPVHDRGKVLVHGMLMLAGGGEACSDIEYLRSQGALFGEVGSDTTLYRTLTGIDAPRASP